MNTLPFDMLFEIYKYLNLKEKIMVSKNFKCFKDILKENIINKTINVSLINKMHHNNNIIYYLLIEYSLLDKTEKKVFYPFFVDKETINNLNKCLTFEEQDKLINTILLNGLETKNKLFLINYTSKKWYQIEDDIELRYICIVSTIHNTKQSYKFYIYDEKFESESESESDKKFESEEDYEHMPELITNDEQDYEHMPELITNDEQDKYKGAIVFKPKVISRN